MILNPIGKIVKQCWEKIPKHFPNVALHSFTIMPNHLHGIIEITVNVGAKNLSPNINNDFQTENMANWNRAKSISPLRSPSKTLGSIVRGFKIGVTKWVRNNTDIHQIWQRNYHEHIIRNEQSYFKIAEYIENNPLKWEEDCFYK